MKKLILILLLAPSLMFGQAIVGTKGTTFTAGVPTHTPSILGAWTAVDTVTNYEYNYDFTSGTWKFWGHRIQFTGTYGAPSYTPDKFLSPVAVNIGDSLYVYQGGWSLLSGGGGGPEINDLTAAVTWDNVPDANITQSSVVQHEAALTITESQISDLNHTVNTDDQTLSIDSTANSYSLSIEDGNTVSWTKTSLSGYVTGSGTTNELPYWATSSSLGSLSTATYPSLTELSYVKGVTSAIQTQLDAKHGGSLTSGYIPYSSGGYGLANSGVQYDNASGAVTFPSATTGGAIMRDWTASSQYFAIYPKSVTPGAGNYSFLTNSTSAYLNAPGSGGNAIISVQGTEKARFSASTIGLNSTGTANTAVTIKGSGSTNLTTALLVENSLGTDALEVKDDGGIAIGTPAAQVERVTLKGGLYIYADNGTNPFRVRGSDGCISFGGYNASVSGITSSFSQDPNGGTLGYIEPTTWATGGNNIGHWFYNRSASSTSGNLIQYKFGGKSGESFNPTSGTATYTALSLQPGINQTGTASGSVTGIDYSPTVTSVLGSHYGMLIRSGQVGIGTGTPAASAKVDITSTTQGLLPPRMTTAQRDAISSPELGLQLVSTTDSLPYYWNGTAYVGMYADGTGTDSQDFTGSDDGTTFTWDLSGAVNDPSITEGQNISMSRTGEDVTVSLDRVLDDNTFTPTLTNILNIASATASVGQYMRVGSTATVSGMISVTASASGATTIDMSLPIASAVTNSYEVSGHFANLSNSIDGICYAEVVTDVVRIQYNAPNTSAHQLFYHYTYRIK